ncbi:DUF4229 domain-containing protein [Lapillicoccus sp.]|jgi:hypothetical protein|uniref:DUF4229 domain-containing protein n=1 Tax=Lapillicoccus sp. TaxID=1909287 RepID=UPI0025EEC7CB|nr:DUF4229 domain-containing protein [Lapillicoccus sp.]
MKNTVLRFTLMRLMIFFGCLLVFWLLGLRSQDQQPWLLLASAVTSVILSYFLLRRERDRMSERIAETVDRRLQARREGVHGEDEDAEDAELEGGR